MDDKVKFTGRDNHSQNKKIDGREVTMPPIGYCHIRIHSGYLDTKLMKEHKCLEKQCPFLERNEDHPEWKKREFHKLHKKIGKILRRQYLNGAIKLTTYDKLVRRLEKCKTKNSLFRFCNYLQNNRNIDVPDEVYYELIPDREE